MKTLLLPLLACCAVSTMRADDVADARQAFDTMVAYQKTDDPRSPDLFAPDIALTVTLVAGTKTKDMTVPPEIFRDTLARSLTKKQGSKDKYEDVQTTQEGGTLKVTTKYTEGGSGKGGTMVFTYARDTTGQLKIKTMHLTIPVDRLPGEAP